MSQSTPHPPHRSAWVAAWSEAVRSCTKPVTLVDVESARFTAVSSTAAAVYGLTPDQLEGASYLELAERPEEAGLTFQLAKEGRLDGLRVRRGFRQPDGSVRQVEGLAWTIRGAPLLGLWVGIDDGEHLGAAAQALAPLGSTDLPGAGATTVTLDDAWRVATGPLPAWGDRQPVGTSILTLTHPDDHPALLLGFAQATTGPAAAIPLRVADGDGGWNAVWARAAATVGAGALELSLTLHTGQDHDRLAWSTDLGRLTAREEEVASRLLRGQRVATMAREMHLGRSTVRNHLVAIFRKAGVHSQDELIELLRRHGNASGGASGSASGRE